jgi:hypothetical protein
MFDKGRGKRGEGDSGERGLRRKRRNKYPIHHYSISYHLS